MLLALTILVLLIILAVELPGLIKSRQYRELQVFFVLFLLSAYLTLAQLYQWPIPNPLANLYPLLAH